MNQEIDTQSLVKAISELAEIKNLNKDIIIDAIKEALKKAYYKHSGDDPDSIIRVDIDDKTGHIAMFKIKNVVEDIQDDVFETDPEEAKETTGLDYKVGDTMETPIDISEFQRFAAIQAKNVFKQKLREAEKQIIFDQYHDKIHDIITGVIERVEKTHCLIKINNTYAYLSKANTLPNESLVAGRPIKVYVEDVDKKATGAQVVVSRTAAGFVTRLMEQDIAEIYDGTVEIKGIARQAGNRSKVAVFSRDPNVDPSGACIGPKGTRIQRIISQIGNERIDVINYNDNPILYIADALKPAIVTGVKILSEEEKTSIVIVNQDQFSLAIGKEAQNVNLAVKLTGWKMDIKNLEEAAELQLDYQIVEDVRTMEAAKKRVVQSTPSVAPIPTIIHTEEPITAKVEEKPTIKIVEEPVIEEKETVIIPTPTKTRPGKSSLFNELEAALSPTSQTSQAKADNKKKEEKKTEVKPTAKTPSNVLPIYTAEELARIEAEEAAEETSAYDDEIDFDEYEEFYK